LSLTASTEEEILATDSAWGG